MKHLKKLSVVLMLTALFSVTFTSCIDNEVSPVVEAIYEAQADLIAAQAGVQNAEAAYLLAQAEAEQAQAEYTLALAAQVDAHTAGIVANNAYAAAQRVQYLLQLVAQTNLNVAQQQHALELAQVNFQIQLAAAIAAMEAAGAQLAVGYAWDYAYAMNHANNLMSQILSAKADLAMAELMQNGNVSWEFYLAQLEGEVAVKIAAKTNLETAIAAMEAYIANPTTPEAVLSGLKALKADYEAAIDAKEIEMAAQMNKIIAIGDVNDLRNELVDNYEDAKDELDYALSVKEDLEVAIADWEDDIEFWQLALDNYDAALAALQLAVTNATTVKNAAVATQAAAVTAQATATTNNTNAINALAALNAELALLNTSYQDAIQDLADETALYNAGLPAVQAALVSAQADLTAGNAAVTVAQADYDAKKAVFEANPTGFVWTGGPNGAVGLHADATTVTNSYREVNTTDNGVLALSLTAGLGLDKTGAFGTYAAFLADATAGALAPGDYYNVGGDDVAEGTHADRLEAAADVLTAALNAIAPLETAVEDAQYDVDHFGDDLAAAQLEYDYQKNLYENQLALVATAEALVATTGSALTAANTALTAANTALAAANTALAAANLALANFLALPDEDALQGLIDAALLDIAAAELEIANIVPVIAAYQAILDDLQVEYDAYIASVGSLSGDPAYSDLHAEIIAEWQVYWVMEQELAILNNSLDLTDDLIFAYGSADDLDDLATSLALLLEDLADAIYDIEVAEQALAAAQVEEAADEAYLAYLEALITTLEARHANTLAIAAKYKALMEAALAS